MNIIDKYRGWSFNLIKNDLQTNNNNFIVCMDHISYDFNISQVLRNSNAFGAKEMLYVGKKKWDRRGAVGTHNYTDLTYLESPSHLKDHISSSYFSSQKPYCLISIEQHPNSHNLYEFDFSLLSDYTPCFVFGNELDGITSEIILASDYIIEIPQYGSVRSLNAGSSSAVVLSYWANYWSSRDNSAISN